MRADLRWPACLALWLLLATAAQAANTDRVVVAGGGLTEILYALGVADHIVGVDTTSTYPPAAQSKPQVGYMRALSAGGVLSLSPTRVITTDEAGPQRSLDLISAAGVTVQQLPAPRSVDDVLHNIRTLATLFNRPERGRQLMHRLHADLRDARQHIQRYAHRPRVLFVLSARSQLLAGGRDTAADTMIRLAGGDNVVDYAGYKPLTPEAAVTMAPEVILTASHVINALGGRRALLSRPAIALTPAGRHDRLVVMDSERLLAFGPRLGKTVARLARRLHEQGTP